MKHIVVEKRVPLFSPDMLVALSNLGVKIEGGSGRVFVELSVAPENEKEVLRLARAEGYVRAEDDQADEKEA